MPDHPPIPAQPLELVASSPAKPIQARIASSFNMDGIVDTTAQLSSGR
jgi:hypothetical protein